MNMFCGLQRKRIVEETESQLIAAEERHWVPITVQQRGWARGYGTWE